MSVETDAKPQAQFFTLGAQLLSQGRSDTTMAQTDLLKLRLKVYASGGENVLHRHTHEDHAFIVLQGEATFHIGVEDETRVVKKYEGVMLPRGVSYWFQSSAPENLVMLRTGAAEEWPEKGRLAPDGHHIPGSSAENKQVPRIPIPGKFFGA